ncbi:MAG: hypothetical protein Q8P72_05075 [Candidatus Roizmanbacteria bacterium]|nr:hypothetical protein [Candidatus Roizmanbacteria bacterium]
MRFQTEFNYMLKIRVGQGLSPDPKEGEIYDFEKTIERIYPLNTPMYLIDDDYKVYGKCVILEYSVGHGITKGKYKLFELYDSKTSQLLTEDVLRSFTYLKTLTQ